jgi:predicted NAD-dependent protein-ADP-ribosyltransferase YbiA (DUF1768 family)
MIKIIQLAKDFKDDVLIPLANEGALDSDLLLEVLDLYASELAEKTNPDAPVIIGSEGKFSNLHPSIAGPVKIEGKDWPTIEHYRLAVDFTGVDDELIEHIREAKTTAIAKRRYENALLGDVKQRYDYETLRDEDLKKAYVSFLRTLPELVAELKATGKVQILFQGTTDPYLGVKNAKDGYNAVGKTLMQLRSEL